MSLTLYSSPEVTISGKTSTFYCVNNPLIWVFHTDETAADYLLTIQVYKGVTLFHTEEFQKDTNGYIYCDLTEILRGMLTIENTFNYTAQNNDESNIYSAFKITADGDWTDTYGEPQTETIADIDSVYCVHSAKQIPDKWGSTMGDYELSDLAGKFLTFFNKPKYWNGYPFSLDFLYYNNQIVANSRKEVVEHFDGTQDSPAYTGLTDVSGLTRMKLTGNYASDANKLFVSIYNSLPLPSGQTLTETKEVTIFTDCIKNPLYVRWINELGGAEYWLFNINQISEIEMAEQEIQRLYVTNLITARGSHQVNQIRKLKRYVVGDEQLSSNEFDVISRQLGGSIQCEYWDSVNNYWITAMVIPAKYSRNTRDNVHKIEIGLVLPELYTQRR